MKSSIGFEHGSAPLPSPPALRFLRERIDQLEDVGLLRRPSDRSRGPGLSFGSNDYLGLSSEVVVRALSGATGSRLVVGTSPSLAELESALASWLGVDRCLLFSSGYAANVGVLSALAEPGDIIISDSLNHASIIDGARLSRAQVVVVPHLDLGAFERALEEGRGRRMWVVTESYFSMDADTPNLAAMRRLCDAAGASLIVDEAHSLGVFGQGGRGLCSKFKVAPDILVGALGKAFGTSGAFVAGCDDLITWLWNRARSFVFSTGMSPLVASASLESLRSIRYGRDVRRLLSVRYEHLRRELRCLGFDPLGHGPIVPLLVGSSSMALHMSDYLSRKGIYVPAIRPPTVPPNSSRLRFTVTARHSELDLSALVEAIKSWPMEPRDE